MLDQTRRHRLAWLLLIFVIDVVPTPSTAAKIYIAGRSKAVIVVDTDTDSVLERTTTPTFNRGLGLPVPHTDFLVFVFMQNNKSSFLNIFQLPALELIASVRSNTAKGPIVADRDGQNILMPAQNTIEVFDVASRSWGKELPKFTTGIALAAAHRSPLIYATGLPQGEVAAIDAATAQVVSVIPVPGWAHDVAVSSDDRTLYVLAAEARLISVIDADTRQVSASIPVTPQPGAPTGMVAVADTGMLYVANTTNGGPAATETGRFGILVGNYVSVVDLRLQRVVTSISMDGPLTLAAAVPERHRLYWFNERSGIVSVLDTVTNTVVATIATGSND